MEENQRWRAVMKPEDIVLATWKARFKNGPVIDPVKVDTFPDVMG